MPESDVAALQKLALDLAGAQRRLAKMFATITDLLVPVLADMERAVARLNTLDAAGCDQCGGPGWVRIAGKVDGGPCGYETVTECTACNPDGARPYRGTPIPGPLTDATGEASGPIRPNAPAVPGDDVAPLADGATAANLPDFQTIRAVLYNALSGDWEIEASDYTRATEAIRASAHRRAIDRGEVTG